MREGWRETTLGAVTTKIVKSAPAQDFDYVDISSVSRSAKAITASVRMNAGDAPGRARQHLRANDVLVSTVRPNLNAVARVPEQFDGAVGSTGFAVLRASDEVHPGILFAVARSSKFVESMTERSTGSNYPAVTDKIVREFPFGLPPIEEQRRIVDLIAAVDDAVDTAEAESDGVAAVLRASLNAVALDQMTSIGSLASVVSGASWGKADVQSDAGDGVTPVLTIANTKPDGTISGEPTLVYGLTSKVARLKASSLIAIRTNGNHNRIGNVYRTPEEHVGAAVSAFQFVVEPIESADSDFLYWMMTSPSFQSAVTAEASGSTGLGNIAASKLREMQIPWPADQELRAAHAITFARAAELANTARETADALRALRTNLLTVLLSGEHEIPASYDALLEGTTG